MIEFENKLFRELTELTNENHNILRENETLLSRRNALDLKFLRIRKETESTNEVNSLIQELNNQDLSLRQLMNLKTEELGSHIFETNRSDEAKFKFVQIKVTKFKK